MMYLKEPFYILRCDARVFRNCTLLAILLSLLETFRNASALHIRNTCTRNYHDDPLKASSGPADHNQYILVQDCLIIQFGAKLRFGVHLTREIIYSEHKFASDRTCSSK